MKYLGVDLLNLYGRFTTSAGRGLTRVMASKVGGKSISKVYRTASDGTQVMLKTMNGMPRITGSKKQTCDVTVSASTTTPEENQYLIHTVTLTKPTTASRRFVVSFKDGTAVAGTHFVAQPLPDQLSPDSDVTFAGMTVTLAAGRSSFDIWVEISRDSIERTYQINVGCASGIGTITILDA